MTWMYEACRLEGHILKLMEMVDELGEVMKVMGVRMGRMEEVMRDAVQGEEEGEGEEVDEG